MDSPLLGIEIGGTKLQLGVGDGASAELRELRRYDVDSGAGAQAILATIEQAAKPMIARHGVARIGIGFGGPVREGIVTKSHQVAGWDRFPLAAWCRERLGVDAVVANDCDAAALAEARFGAGRDAQAVFYVTVGTGVGGGWVWGGRLYGTNRPAVAEIGHLRPGIECVSHDDTLEHRSAGPGIAARAVELMEAARTTLDPEAVHAAEELSALCQAVPARLTARHVAQAAQNGNPLARRALHDGLRALAWGIAQVITLLAPDVVVVGGGVSLMGEEPFFVPLRDYVLDYVFPPLVDSYRIVPAALREEVVVVGGLLLAREAG